MITPRLEMILRHVKGKTCADIGTDHAYVPIKLAEAGIKVIATDIMPGPLKIAAENVKKQNADVELRLGGGLSPIKKREVDTVIIAGMGGEMIEKIISEDKDKAKEVRLILQPMNRQAELREYLIKSGFNILEEDLAKEGFKVYNLIVAEYSDEKGENFAGYEREIDRHLPKCLYENTYFDALLEKKKREFTKILEGLKKSKDANLAEIKKLEELLLEIEKIKEQIK
ncbi:MAG: SAM-dependent methyltransferase [Clostridia bacterium]|nr:SAM-dependent methyltransferase [Clostridia bacterium]